MYVCKLYSIRIMEYTCFMFGQEWMLNTSGPVMEDKKKGWAFLRINIYVFMAKFLEKQVWPDISSPTDLFRQGLLNKMDRTLRALAKFESSRPGLILGTQITPLGVDFLDHNFLSSKNSG